MKWTKLSLLCQLQIHFFRGQTLRFSLTKKSWVFFSESKIPKTFEKKISWEISLTLISTEITWLFWLHFSSNALTRTFNELDLSKWVSSQHLQNIKLTSLSDTYCYQLLQKSFNLIDERPVLASVFLKSAKW